MHAVIEEARDRRYAIGRHDCALFVIAAVERITGKDYGKRVRGGYKTVAGSLRLIASMGHGLQQAVERVTGEPAIRPGRVMRGDPVLYVDDGGREHLGLCVGDQAAVLAEDGLMFVSMDRIDCGWNL